MRVTERRIRIIPFHGHELPAPRGRPVPASERWVGWHSPDRGYGRARRWKRLAAGATYAECLAALQKALQGRKGWSAVLRAGTPPETECVKARRQGRPPGPGKFDRQLLALFRPGAEMDWQGVHRALGRRDAARTRAALERLARRGLLRETGDGAFALGPAAPACHACGAYPNGQRGLCTRCYESCRERVKAGETTWDEILKGGAA